MNLIRPVPELHDGGYWVVCPIVVEEEIDPEGKVRRVRTIPEATDTIGWSMWDAVVDGQEVAAVRLSRFHPAWPALNIRVGPVLAAVGRVAKPVARVY